MAFSSVTSRLASLPLVLAGPIVRRVDEDAVTVWVAVKLPCSVTLKCQNAGSTSSFSSASAEARRIGPSLYVVAVTARGTVEKGQLFTYDVTFTGSGVEGGLLSPKVISQAGGESARKLIAYGDLPLPSFCLPANTSGLVIAQGSCREHR